VDHAYAVEPAATMNILKQNTQAYADRITYLNVAGHAIELEGTCDLAISLGVISYIPEPLPTFTAVARALRPGGKFLVLVMSREGNEFYCSFVEPLRKITTALPDGVLRVLCHILAAAASGYGAVCKLLSLPLHNYFNAVFSKMAWRERVLLVFDQLNPAYTHYYTGAEVRSLFERAGFVDVKMVHRYGYSWAAIGSKC
jgi:SAM-dependent methyltransferase